MLTFFRKAAGGLKKLVGAKAAQTLSEGEEVSGLLGKIITMLPTMFMPVVIISVAFVMILFFPIFNLMLGTLNVQQFTRSVNEDNSSGTTDYLDWALEIAADDSHGYSQCGRTGPDYDCSSLVWYSLVEGAGIDASTLGGYAFTTYVMGPLLKNAGFEEYPFTSEADLQPGDILVFTGNIFEGTGHTEIYVGDGKNVGAHIAETGDVCGVAGDQTGSEISVANFYVGNWDHYYRLPGALNNNNSDSNGEISVSSSDLESYVNSCRSAGLSNGVNSDLQNTSYKNKETFSSHIKDAVRSAGYGTRAGVVAATVALAGEYPSITGKRLKYWDDARHGSNWEQAFDTLGIVNDDFYIDCSSFNWWALYNGGFNVPSGTVGSDHQPYTYSILSWSNQNGYSKSPKKGVGQPGDFMVKNGHIRLIVGTYDDGYYAAESTTVAGSGVMIRKFSYSEVAQQYVIVDMTKYYNNSSNVRNGG